MIDTVVCRVLKKQFTSFAQLFVSNLTLIERIYSTVMASGIV